MIRSIRQFLLISLLISITIASSITAVGNYILDKKVIQPYLDEQLVKIFSLIEMLHESTHNDVLIRKEITRYFQQSKTLTTQRLFFKVWSKDGKILIQSAKNIPDSLYNTPLGFSDLQIQGNDWRIYSVVDAKYHKIVIAELYDIRNKLADDITRNNAYILLVTYPIFGILIWLIVGIALRSITR